MDNMKLSGWLTSSHSAPWNTTRLSHSRHLDGARSFLSLCVWAALDIWVLRKGPGELAISVPMSMFRPGGAAHGGAPGHKKGGRGGEELVSCKRLPAVHRSVANWGQKHLSFTFKAVSRCFYPKLITISTFVRICEILKNPDATFALSLLHPWSFSV